MNGKANLVLDRLVAPSRGHVLRHCDGFNGVTLAWETWRGSRSFPGRRAEWQVRGAARDLLSGYPAPVIGWTIQTSENYFDHRQIGA